MEILTALEVRRRPKRGRVNHFLVSADGNLDARKDRGNSDSSQWYGMGTDELRVALPSHRGQLDEAKRTVRPSTNFPSFVRAVLGRRPFLGRL